MPEVRRAPDGEVMAKWVRCLTCQGNGVIKEIKNGKVTEKPCPARCNNGKVNTGTI